MARPPWSVLIVDDEKPARDRVRRLLSGHADFRVAGEAADADAAVEKIDAEAPDLVFLDVRMPEGDGFDVLERCREAPRVIFTTAFDQYAVRAFEVNSIDYLLKPFDKARFGEALDRARAALDRGGGPDRQIVSLLRDIKAGLPARSLEHAPGSAGARVPAGADAAHGAPHDPERIAARRGSKIVLLTPEEILWFEAEDTLVFARSRDGRFLVSRTLSDLEDSLAPGFFRAHRGYLVNLDRIGEILPGDEDGHYRIVMKDEAKSSVPLSRRQARRLREIIPW